MTNQLISPRYIPRATDDNKSINLPRNPDVLVNLCFQAFRMCDPKRAINHLEDAIAVYLEAGLILDAKRCTYLLHPITGEPFFDHKGRTYLNPGYESPLTHEQIEFNSRQPRHLQSAA